MAKKREPKPGDGQSKGYAHVNLPELVSATAETPFFRTTIFQSRTAGPAPLGRLRLSVSTSTMAGCPPPFEEMRASVASPARRVRGFVVT